MWRGEWQWIRQPCPIEEGWIIVANLILFKCCVAYTAWVSSMCYEYRDTNLCIYFCNFLNLTAIHMVKNENDAEHKTNFIIFKLTQNVNPSYPKTPHIQNIYHIHTPVTHWRIGIAYSSVCVKLKPLFTFAIVCSLYAIQKQHRSSSHAAWTQLTSKETM